MASGGLHAGEIDCLGSRMLAHDGTVRWLGVFARDELPDLSRVPRPFALVLNTDPHDKPGQHWLAIYGPRNGRLELFDSFGMPAAYYKLDTLDLHYHNVAYQSLDSALCGHYCLFFIYLRSHNHSFDSVGQVLRLHRNTGIDSYTYLAMSTSFSIAFAL